MVKIAKRLEIGLNDLSRISILNHTKSKKYLLFTPGPVNVEENVRMAICKEDICHREKDFDVLCIDVEGAEWKILEVFNIDEWNPKMAIIETHEKHPNEIKRKTGNSEVINEYFFKHKYVQIYVDEINSIYVKG